MLLSSVPVMIAEGLDGGDTSGFIWGLLLFTATYFLLFPVVAIRGYYYHGVLAYLQVPLVIAAVVYVVYRQIRRPACRPFLKIATTYIAFTLGTNITGLLTEVNHSKDFPLTSHLLQLQTVPPVTAAQIIARYGTPTEDSHFTITDAHLAYPLHSAFERAGIHSARVLRYDETSRWSDHTICYLIHDELTGRLINIARHYAPPGAAPSPPTWKPL